MLSGIFSKLCRLEDSDTSLTILILWEIFFACPSFHKNGFEFRAHIANAKKLVSNLRYTKLSLSTSSPTRSINLLDTINDWIVALRCEFNRKQVRIPIRIIKFRSSSLFDVECGNEFSSSYLLHLKLVNIKQMLHTRQQKLLSLFQSRTHCDVEYNGVCFIFT